jgi:hypothetical protein
VASAESAAARVDALDAAERQPEENREAGDRAEDQDVAGAHRRAG